MNDDNPVISAKEFAAAFVHQSNALVDNPDVPVSTRWEYVLKHVPEARGKFIFEDFEKALTRAYGSSDRDEVAAALELARLRYFFYRVLMHRGVGRSHINSFHIINSEKWVMKLVDRFDSLKPAKFHRGKFLPAKVKKVSHTWLN